MLKVIIGKDKYITNYTDEELNRIKDDLTLPNPQYAQVKKFSKWKTTKVPKYLFYYTQLKNAIIVPRGYNIPFEYFIEEDNRNEIRANYPPFKLSLRETQREAVINYLDDPDKGLIVLPTGKGKSILGLYLAQLLRQKTLVIVHKDDLVDGWTKDSLLCFGDDFKVGIYKAKKRQVGEQITIATIQTLNRLSPEQLEEFQSNFGMVICDEVHHIASSSFDLLHRFSCCYKIGLSATPERSDGLTKVMYYHLGDCAFKYEANENDKDILPVKVLVRTMPIEEPILVKQVGTDKKRKPIYELATREDEKRLTGRLINITDIDYNRRPRVPHFEIDDRVLTNKKFSSRVIKDVLKEYREKHSCVCFFTQKRHIELYRDLLVAEGVPENEILLYYGDSKESKDTMKQRAESRQALITLATYSIATEGTNVKAWEVAFLVSSINNEKNTEQAVGRVRRSKEGKINPVLVYDYTLPNIYSIGTNHFNTRNRRYKKLGFTVEQLNAPQKQKGMFSRGFKK